MVYSITTGRKKSVHSKKWKRCVAKVKRTNKSKNPYAICTSRLGKQSFIK